MMNAVQIVGIIAFALGSMLVGVLTMTNVGTDPSKSPANSTTVMGALGLTASILLIFGGAIAVIVGTPEPT